MNDSKHVGYIGLGNIGKPSARHLVSSGFKTYVFDVFAEAMEDLIAEGATGCHSAAQLAKECSHIGICVRDGEQVESLLYGDGGILSNAKSGTVVAIHSTVNRDEILKWAADGAEAGIHVIDAGISGGAQGAEAGTLVYMVGGEADVVERATPVFMSSAADVIHAGDVGAGMVLKLCNNLVTYLQFQAMSEAAKLAEASGIQVDMLRRVGETNGVISEQMHSFISGRNAMSAACSDEDMAAMFGPFGQLGEKDLACALECAGQLEINLPFTKELQSHVYDMFVNKF